MEYLSSSERVAEIIKDRLYWVSDSSQPHGVKNGFYFNVDSWLKYDPYFSDFGPVSLAQTHRFVTELGNVLREPKYKESIVFHLTSHDSSKRANAAYLMGAFQVLILGRTAVEAFDRFQGIAPPFRPFRDASHFPCSYECTVLDCLMGLEYATKLGWFSPKSFDLLDYELYSQGEHGNMNWIVPSKFLAFSSPNEAEAGVGNTVADYVPLFKKMKVTAVVRLNNPSYKADGFKQSGINHYDIIFKDGSCPPPEKYREFLEVAEKEKCLAVHCKAGLGRTGSMIAIYVMKHYKFPAPAFIGWIRICRPGSVLGPQQHFLNYIEAEVQQAESEIFDSLPPSAKEFLSPANLQRVRKDDKDLVMNAEEEKVYHNGDPAQAQMLLQWKASYKKAK